MAENKLFYYREFPLLRQGNTIYYGCGGDDFAALLTIKDTKAVNGEEIPNRIMVQLIPTDMSNLANMAKVKDRKGEFTGFYESLDTAHLWLCEALFG